MMMNYSWFSVGVGVLVMTWTWLSWWRRRKLPPGPFPLPVVGNLLDLGRRPHDSLTELSRKYGPLMSIHLGSLYTVVVSSPEMAKEILQKHGQVFSGRPIAEAVLACDHNKISMGFLPTASIWRDMRKICKEQIFSHGSLEASRGLRRHKLQQLLDYAQRCCDEGRAVDIREAAFITTVNLMSATLFSTQATEFDSSEDTRGLKENVEGVVSIVGLANMADFFPILKPFDLQGIKRRAGVCFTNLLDMIEGYLNQRVEWRKAKKTKHDDFLETLTDIMEDEDNNGLTTQHAAHLMLDLLVGGSETNTTTIEWIMSALVLNPEKMEKVREEIRVVVGDEKMVVDESEIGRLPYLQAVVKEVLRYTPPGPFLVPRKAESDQLVNGYLIPKGAQILINVWAMARDSAIWDNPHCFEPERFLLLEQKKEEKIEFKGHHFQLIPFGSGRRMCPGMPLADRILHTTIATLVHNFDWKLEEGATDADHRADLFGVSVRRAVPLRIIPHACHPRHSPT
ncbi:hypothetical protein C2S52_006803 [Perilla frutescens var. hirtella]|nr:hypothetical protein C2S52_006803 [Perilla frutescens var. hirtella]